jgi:hypothetical protein
MVHDRSQEIPNAATGASSTAAATAAPRQAVAGVMPPQLGEAMIREAFPSVAQSGLSRLASKLMRSVVLAPLGWLLLAPLFLKKIAPFLCTRYTLTNRRLMIRRGLKPHPVREVALADIDDVRLVPDSYNAFYRCGTLEVLGKGQVTMTLPAVPEPEGFRQAVINAYKAWVPGKADNAHFIPASAGNKS